MQSVQGPPAPENLPETQFTQLEGNNEPGSDEVPAKQLLQNEAPVSEEYLPARHSVQGPPAPDNLPETQSTQLLEPAGDDFPAVQFVQVLDDVRPRAVENVPAMHAVQTVAPLSSV
jgi:hypothetical protein